MTEQVHFRIERNLVKRAKRICAHLGITPTQAVSMFFAQLVRNRGLPFRPSARLDDELIDVERRNRILRDLDDSEGW
jgi:addiction module RelB/DinJ family antitoxin